MPPSGYHDTFAARGARYHNAMCGAPLARATEIGIAIALADLREGMVLADLPAGGGYLTPLPQGVAVVAIEGAAGFTLGRDVLRCDDLCAVPLPDGAVDRLICLAAAHHIQDEQGLYRELCRLVRPGGLVVLADGRRDSPEASFLNGFVHRNTSTGHEGRFLDDHSEARLRDAGFADVQGAMLPVDWQFPNETALEAFCFDLFGLECERVLMLDALRRDLGVVTTTNGVALRWSLQFFVARKAPAADTDRTG
jgi:SAM-dependent methyltransferase